MTRAAREPARHERPSIDEAALTAARDARRLLAGAQERGVERWVRVLEPLPEELSDAGLGDLRKVAMRARSIYGPKDSIRDALPPELTEPFLADIDRLLKALARDAMER